MHRSLQLPRLVTIAVLTLAGGVAIPGIAAESTGKACNTPAHREFDFWLGSWEVTQNGKIAGKNRIESILGGCALLESWVGASGLTGHSLNIYDATRGVWHQTWVDSSGTLLMLEGHRTGDSMVLEGTLAGQKGAPASRQRITWTRLSNADVRQWWQSSTDDGRTWKTEFDGHYRRTAQ